MNNTSDLTKHYFNQPYNHNKVVDEFGKPIFENVFFRNIDMLLLNSTGVKFDNDSWVYRPMNFCQDYYNVAVLFHVVLLVNNIPTLFDFQPNNFHNKIILAPHKSKIFGLLSTN